MCGIAGFLNIENDSSLSVPRHELEIATDRLRSRGPDDGHVWISENNLVGFGHRRLSVIDVSARGRQPMLDDVGNSLVFNGEIYNFKELKHRFRGESFTSGTDTEVLLKGLSHSGSEFISDLDGMFAFAFFNKRENKVLLATDPAGKKPIYTYWDGKKFIFASELKAILAFQDCDFSIDKQKVQQSLVFGYVPYPHTIYNRILKLPAGHFQEIDLARGPSAPKIYWDVPIGQIRNDLSFRDAQVELKALVGRAVEKRLISDVPLGCFLSGGLDSSLVALEASRRLKREKLKTFAAAFSNDPLSRDYDESKFARLVAERIGSEHLEMQILTGDANANAIMQEFGEPFGDSSAIPTNLICGEAKKHVSVVLSGDGGDELFGGYLRFRAALTSEKYKTLWQVLLAPIAATQSRPANQRSLLGKLQRFTRAIDKPLIERLALWNAFFSEKDLEHFLNERVDVLCEHARIWDEKTHGLEIGEKILYYNYKTYLFDDLLPKVDRMSMSHGLEVRSPLLDRALTEFAFRLPTSFKFDAFQTKKILKAAYRDELGPDIVDRRKQGFAFPLESFLKHQDLETGSATRTLFPKVRSHVDTSSSSNLTAKQFMLWSVENSLKAKSEDPV